MELAGTKENETNNKGSLPWKSSEPRRGALEETQPMESQGQARVSCYCMQPWKTGWFSDGASLQLVFHFTNSTLAATERMNQSLRPLYAKRPILVNEVLTLLASRLLSSPCSVGPRPTVSPGARKTHPLYGPSRVSRASPCCQ